MGCTVEHYWEQHTRHLEEKFAVAIETEVMLIDDDPLRGFIDARIYFHEEDVFVDAHEKVTTTGDDLSKPRRERYVYHLMIRDYSYGRWHYDPKLPEGQQFHFDDDFNEKPHLPDEHRSLKNVVSQCWDVITDFLEVIDNETE